MFVLLQRISAVALLAIFAASQAHPPQEGAEPLLKVEEQAISVSFEKGQLDVEVPLRHSFSSPHLAWLKAELVAPDGSSIKSMQGQAILRPGTSAASGRMSIPMQASQWKDDLWDKHRLRYDVQTRPLEGIADAASPHFEGIVALSHIYRDNFSLKLAMPVEAAPGDRVKVWALATHPNGSDPQPAVRLDAEIEMTVDGKQMVRQAGAETGADGLAALQFDLPAKLEDESLEVQIEARRGRLVRRTSDEFRIGRGRARIVLTTDKPLYQPSQTLHMRLVAILPSGMAGADEEMRVTIKDQEERTVFEERVTATQFGVAAADWNIPDSIRQGHYTIWAVAESSRWDQVSGYKSVEIRNYELPTFSVEVKPDRSFYLAGQPVKLQVTGQQLSGEKLPSGKVRIVREKWRRWHYRLQQWDLGEEVVAEGELDSSGIFDARLDLGQTDPFEDLSDHWRFQDLQFTAYLTDPLTGRTEQRRFDLRFSADPIHVYWSKSGYSDGSLQGYVTTFYADGRPAQCRVQVRMPDSLGKALADVETNRYGVARLSFGLPDDPELEGEIQLVARDGSGQGATWNQRVWRDDALRMQLQTDRTIYRKGEPLRLEIASDPRASVVLLDVYGPDGLLVSRRSALKDGRLSLKLPYRPTFSGLLTINAYSPPMATDEDVESLSALAQVIYPQSGIEVEARTEAVYRPGQQARAEFRLTGQGRPLQGALGVVIADRGVYERLRSDNESRGWSGWSTDWGARFADPLRILERFGIDPQQIDLAQPIAEEIQLAAEAAYNSSYRYGYRHFYSMEPEPNYRWLFKTWFDQQREKLVKALNQGGEVFLDPSIPGRGLDDLLKASNLALADFPDPWGNPYQPKCWGSWGANLALTSSGPDERPGNGDDFTVLRVYWPYYGKVGQAIEKAAQDLLDQRLQPLQDESALAEELMRRGIDLNALRDPCGAPLRLDLSFEGQREILTLRSAGRDRQFGTRDDYRATEQSWNYFEPLGQLFDRALEEHHQRSGGLIWDAATLRRELLPQGIDLDALRDPWGNPYRVEVKIKDHLHSVSLHSSGEDGQFGAVDKMGRSDDFMIWEASVNYYEDEKARVVAALDSLQKRSGKTPATPGELEAALSEAGVGPAQLHDPWGRPFRLAWELSQKKYDTLLIGQYAVYGHPPQQRVAPGQSTLQLARAGFRSSGQDGIAGNQDDFDAFRLTLVLKEIKTALDADPKREAHWLELASGNLSGAQDGSGVITGIIVDAMGAVLPGAEITATHNSRSLTRTVVSNDTGRYTFNRLPPGLYSLRFEMTGFQQLEIVGVPVSESTQTPLDVRLEIGNITETVTVSAGPDPIQTESATLAAAAPAGGPEPVATPRLRQYFPETLVWAPLLETDRQGRAVLDFTVADNITTWDLSVLASTADGKIQSGQASFRSFQPFYAQPDPPPILTVGDEIHLPVAVYNYLDQSQSVQLELKSGEWFQPLAPTRQALQVSALDASKATFPIRALEADSEARFRVTAWGQDASDAVEKASVVLPYGEEVVQTESRLIDSSASFEVTVPDEALAGTIQAELKVYPDLISHAFDGIEGIIRRPYGCAEQTISGTYPNLLVLRALESSDPDSSAARRARAYLEKGYQRLMRYRSEQGGFSYWGGSSEATLEVSVHAWKLLSDIQSWVDVDPKVLESTLKWLLEKQQSDGSWEDDAEMTGLMARSLSDGTIPQAAQEPLKRALRYLAEQAGRQVDNPYLLSTFVSAALQAGAEESLRPMIRQAVVRLIETAHDQDGRIHWSSRYWTPFGGWGGAGEIETTAAVTRALRLFSESPSLWGDALTSEALSKAKGAALHLLLSKDLYGVWYSTQATFAALDALSGFESYLKARESPKLALTVNDQPLTTEQQSRAGRLGPLRIDLSSNLVSGANRIRLESLAEAEGIDLAHLVVRYHRNWPQVRPESAASPNFAMRVSYDRQQLRLGDEVTCKVEAERLSWPSGREWRYRMGMLLAEIGLPPGAQIDHSSLQQEMRRLGWVLGRYEVQPDRLVLYLWPRQSGRVELSFRFRPRLAMRAHSAPSLLYDYYNPAARIGIAPALFSVADE